MQLTHCLGIVPQRLPGVAVRVQPHFLGRAYGHHQATLVAPIRPEVDQPVAGADHVQVVLDHDQRMPRLQQLAQGTHQLGDVVEVQARGRLVEQEQHAFGGQRLARRRAACSHRTTTPLAPLAALARLACLGGLGQKTRQLQALRLATTERGHRLAQLHVFQTHIHDRLQSRHHLAVRCLPPRCAVAQVAAPRRGCIACKTTLGRPAKPLQRLAHRQAQHVGHIEQTATALDGDFQNFRAVTLAVAVGAAQIDITQELHLHMLETRTAAGGAAPVAAVETELGRRVAALLGQWCLGKQRTDRIPRAHVTHRIGACRLADGGLIDEHHTTEVIGSQQAVVGSGGFAGLAEVAHQRRGQHVLNEGGFARTADAGDGHQPLQREFDVEAAQVVFACALQHQAGRGVGDHALEAETDLLAPAQVGTRERVGGAQLRDRSIKNDLSAALAGAGAHVDDTIRRQHDGGVVFHHHQGVAGLAQTRHGAVDAVHVARVQADAGLVEHEQGVDQRSAQRRGEVDALHLAATEGAALPVEREVADAHVAQILQAGADFVEQQPQRLRFARLMRTCIRQCCRCGGAAWLVSHRPRFLATQPPHTSSPRQHRKKCSQALDRQLHHVVQGQARQRFQLLPRPLHPRRHEPLGRRQHRIGGGLGTQSPQQAFGLEPRTRAHRAYGVAAVLRQEHANVHLVGLALQVIEEAAHPVPLLVPLATPVRGPFDDPVFLRLAQLVPRRVTRNASGLGVPHQVVLALLPRRGLHGFDGTGTQGQLVVRNHQPHVHPDDAPEAAAGVARPQRRVEGKHGRQRLGIAQVAFGAMQAGGKPPCLGLGLHPGVARRAQRVHREPTIAALQTPFDGFDDPGSLDRAVAETVGHHVQDAHLSFSGWGVLLGLRGFGILGGFDTVVRHWSGDHALGLHPSKAAGRQPLFDVCGGGAGGQFHREGDDQTRLNATPHANAAPREGLRPLGQPSGAHGRLDPLAQIFINGVGRVVPHRQRGAPVK